MKNLYLFFALLIYAGLTQTAAAQSSGTISGTLEDTNGEAISYANVALLHAADSSLLTGAVSDFDGKFNLKTPAVGTYLLRLSAIGFTQSYTASFKVSGPGFSKDFGTLSLKEDVKLLNEVTVQSMRPTIVNHADKMVVSVEGTALAAASTALEVLSRSPGIWIDQDGNIQLNGKGGVKIMIDGRLTYLSAKELQNMLGSMSAENLKDIEIINNPSARFDAEGTAGIININLKKNQLSGLNGSIYTGFQYNGIDSYTSGGNLNYKKGRWNSFVNVDASRWAWARTSHMVREFNTETSSNHFDQKGREEVVYPVQSLRIGTDYDINERHSLGAMVNISRNQSSHDFHTASYLTDGIPQNNLFIDARNHIKSRFSNSTYNLHYTGKFDTTGTTLTAELDYVQLTDLANARFANLFDSLGSDATPRLQVLSSQNPSAFDIYSARIDFVKPFGSKSKLETGLKASYVVSDNDLQFYLQEGPEKTLDESRSNHFIYQENIYAGYITYHNRLNDTWNIQAGLRAEQTSAVGRSLTTGHSTPRNYLNFFPSLFVQQKVSENYQINYNYSRRIERPRYESLNPFIFFLDPYTSAQGNPYLRPQYTHSVQLTQTLKQQYNLVIGYSLTSDFMAEVPVQNNESKTTVFMQRNVDNFENINASLVIPVKIMDKWEMNNNLTGAYQNYTTRLNNEFLQNEQFFYLIQSTQNIQLPKNIRMEVNAGYQGPTAYGLYQIEPTWWVDAGLKRSFMEDKLEVSMNVTDIFRSRQVVGSANIGGNINTFDQYFSAQSFRLNLRYRFNRGEKFEAKNRNVNLEELNRAGGN